MKFEVVKARVLPRSFFDAILGFAIGCFLSVVLFFVPSMLVAFISESLLAAFLVFIVLYVTFLLFIVRNLRVSEEGIEFVRVLGSPKFLAWSEIDSIVPVSGGELIRKGWLWPMFPPREMTVSHSMFGHYRISYKSGYAYFPPKDAAAFLALIPENVMLRSNNSLKADVPDGPPP